MTWSCLPRAKFRDVDHDMTLIQEGHIKWALERNVLCSWHKLPRKIIVAVVDAVELTEDVEVQAD